MKKKIAFNPKHYLFFIDFCSRESDNVSNPSHTSITILIVQSQYLSTLAFKAYYKKYQFLIN